MLQFDLSKLTSCNTPRKILHFLLSFDPTLCHKINKKKMSELKEKEHRKLIFQEFTVVKNHGTFVSWKLFRRGEATNNCLRYLPPLVMLGSIPTCSKTVLITRFLFIYSWRHLSIKSLAYKTNYHKQRKNLNALVSVSLDILIYQHEFYTDTGEHQIRWLTIIIFLTSSGDTGPFVKFCTFLGGPRDSLAGNLPSAGCCGSLFPLTSN